MSFGFADDGFEAGYVGGEDASSEIGKPVVAAARIFVRGRTGRFFDEALIHELLKVVVEGAGAEFVLAVGMAGDFLHDGVPMPVFTGEREQDVKRRRGKRQEGTEIFTHSVFVISDSE